MSESEIIEPEDGELPENEELEESKPLEEGSSQSENQLKSAEDALELQERVNKEREMLELAIKERSERDREEVELAMEKVLEKTVRTQDQAITELPGEAEDGSKASVEIDEVEEEEASILTGPYEEPDDGRRWYVVYENKVRHNLEQRIETMGMKDRIFDVVVPTEEEIEVKEGKRKTIERRVFPGYILVQMIMTEESWYVVRNTPGVTGFVGMGNEPTPLRPEEVSSIIKRMEAEAPRIKVTYKIGQKVRIIDGPFNDFIGTVDNIDMERAKVRVMVSFFGRETPVELDFLQVEKA
jgi:transcriptional antiterminator NusG